MGSPKSELRINNQPILEFLLTRWKWTDPTLLVTAPGRQHPAGWQAFDREVVDEIPRQGPLRGIVTALENSLHAPALIVATCDMPLITRAMLDHLAATLESNEDALAVMTKHDGQIEPFPIIMRSSMLDLLRQRLRSTDHSIHSLTAIDGVLVIEAPPTWDARTWTNLNSPEDYRRLVDENP
jgi:molybdopterin-guanine dinucleotide biosynthesis protein A